MVERGRGMLEGRFVDLVDYSGISYAAYAEHTRQLLGTLDAIEHRANAEVPHRSNLGA